MSASQNFKRSLAAAAALSAVTIGSLVAAASPAEAASSRWCSASGNDRQFGLVTCYGSSAKYSAKATCRQKVLWWLTGPTSTRTGPKVKAPHSSGVVCPAGHVITTIKGVWVD